MRRTERNKTRRKVQATRTIDIYYQGELLVTVSSCGARGAEAHAQYIDKLLSKFFPQVVGEHTFFTYAGKL